MGRLRGTSCLIQQLLSDSVACHKGVCKHEGGVGFIVTRSIFNVLGLCCECGLCGRAISEPAGMVALTIGTCCWFFVASYTSGAWVVV